MIIGLLLIALGILLVTWIASRTAVEGWEDEDGFHLGKPE